MSDNKSSPPTLKKITKIKLKAISLSKKVFKSSLKALIILLTVSFISIKGPEMHNAFLREKVGSKVYLIKGKMSGGGGTGFALEAPSGQTYIVTNSHVCEGALTQSEDKTSLIVADDNGRIMRRRILEISDRTDLCLLEGIPGISGLSIADEGPSLGETQYAVGHPLLRPLSISGGEIVGRQNVEILDFPIETEQDLARCSLPKNEVREIVLDFFGSEIRLRACIVVTKGAYMSTIVIFPGNSGSPIVDYTGDVAGVAFASDGTHYAAIVSISDLKRFISHY
jgi:S1-C subfamily serine protease